MTDPLDSFFGVGKDGTLNLEKEVGTDSHKDVALGEASTMDSGSENPHDADELFDISVIIPLDAELTDVTKLALDAYKQQIDILKFIEPKYRNRGFEVAQQYLNLARDAIKQDAEIKIKQDKQKLEEKKSNVEDGTEEKSDTASKDNLYHLVKQIRNEA